jgi:molybdate transport system substrate-binding protein
MSHPTRARWRTLIGGSGLAALVALALAPACAGPTVEAPPAAPAPVSGTITVSAAASLTDSFTRIGAAFERANPGMKVTFTFDSSTTLARQITEGAPVDVFAAADEPSMSTVTSAGLADGEPRTFARNRMAIVVRKGNPTGIRTLADLANARTVSLCAVEVPCGRYAADVLTRAGVAVPSEKITRGQNVRATFTAVAEGDADAGLVYVTDIAGERVSMVSIPDAANTYASYPVVSLHSAANPTAARAFVDHLLAPDAQTTLALAGFDPPG